MAVAAAVVWVANSFNTDKAEGFSNKEEAEGDEVAAEAASECKEAEELVVAAVVVDEEVVEAAAVDPVIE